MKSFISADGSNNKTQNHQQRKDFVLDASHISDGNSSDEQLSMQCGVLDKEKIRKISVIQRFVKKWLLHR